VRVLVGERMLEQSGSSNAAGRSRVREARSARLTRILVVFGLAGGASLLSFQLAGGGALRSEAPEALEGYSMGVGKYDLAQLELLTNTMYHVDESYVEPARIDYEVMYTEALEAVERRVPVTMFRREPGGQLLHAEMGSTRTVLQVPPITSREILVDQLKVVAALLEANLQPGDIPMDDPTESDPYAQIEYAMVNGILETLDPHSRLLPPEASKEMDVDNAGEFGGLGITILDDDGKLTVDYPLPDTPAMKADLQPGDQIVRIDGVSTINMTLDEAVDKLRGKIGSTVVIEIMRDGLTEPLEKPIVRDRIKLNPIESTLLEGGIGYVSVQGFNALVDSDVNDHLDRLSRDNGGRPLRGLVLDLRGNPGGYLNQAEKLADIFLDHGTVVSQVDANGKKLEEYDAHASGSEPAYPIVVLVNSSSASASEIVSGALRNNERAVIIGQRTYGKGSVQNLHNFVDGSKLKLTISKYLTPGDKSIQAVGIPADIELVPTIVERDTDAKTGQVDDIALLYLAERVRRESNADKHLEQATVRLEEPAYSIRYLRPAKPEARKSAALDLSKDFEVQFARDVLLNAPSSRRADILAASSGVVARYEKKENQRIEAAFQTLGIDWIDGPSVHAATLGVQFDLGTDGVLVAGVEEPVALVVTNNTDKPIYRLTAVATFEGDYTPREFVFGKLMPGETRRYEQPVQLADGEPTELTPVTFSFRDASGSEIAVQHARLPVQGKALPQLAWQTTVSDPSPGGNGNGIPEVGEKVVIGFDVQNVGKGATVDPFARIKNKSGRALDIVAGNLEPGVMRNPDGTECVATDLTKPDEFPKDCKRTLKPGEHWAGQFEVLVKEAPTTEPESIDLELGDASAYDHASIVRNGFYGYFAQRQPIEFNVGQPFAAFDHSVPPVVQVTDAPGVLVQNGQVHVSGVVTDDVGIGHVEIYAGEDKVFFEGAVKGAHVRSVPYTADIALKPGLNTISVLASDESGFTDTHSVVTFYLAPELQAQVGDVMPTGDLPELKRN
jgi:carboxyl-terminal processing protease